MAAGQEVTLVSSRTDTASVSATGGTALTGMDIYRYGSFALAVTDATGSGTFTLDVYIQGYIYGYWTDIAKFSQVTTESVRVMHGVGGTIGTGTTTIEEAQLTGSITAGNLRLGPWGAQIRAYYSLTITGTMSVTWECKGMVQT